MTRRPRPIRRTHRLLMALGGAAFAGVAGLGPGEDSAPVPWALSEAARPMWEAQKRFAELKYEAFGPRERILEILRAGDVERSATAPEPEPADLEEIRRLAAEFIHLRLAERDFPAYRAWRTAQPVRVSTREELDRHGVSDALELVTGERPGADAEIGELFDRLARADTGYGDGVNEPSGIAVDPEACLLCLGRLLPDREDGRADLGGRLGPELWYGPISSGNQPFWPAARSRQDVLKSEGVADVATLGVIVRHADGSARPVLLQFVRLPEHGWVLEYVNTTNFWRPEFRGIVW